MGDFEIGARPRLSEIRKLRGLTQIALAERIGVPQSAIARWETGRHAPLVFAALKLARTLDTTVETLFTSDVGAASIGAIRSGYIVPARYGAISAVAEICEPWVMAWSGDEWGESMDNLLGATHTDYGLSDEDCAVVAEMLLRNVVQAHELDPFGCPNEEGPAREARQRRDYWLKGGNLGDFGSTIEDAKMVIDQMPAWMFGEVTQEDQ